MMAGAILKGKKLTSVLNLPIDPQSIPGVASIVAEPNRMTVMFIDGTKAVVERSPLAPFSDRDSFDVWLPSDRAGFAATVAPSKSPVDVVALLAERARKATA